MGSLFGKKKVSWGRIEFNDHEEFIEHDHNNTPRRIDLVECK